MGDYLLIQSTHVHVFINSTILLRLKKIKISIMYILTVLVIKLTNNCGELHAISRSICDWTWYLSVGNLLLLLNANLWLHIILIQEHLVCPCDFSSLYLTQMSILQDIIYYFLKMPPQFSPTFLLQLPNYNLRLVNIYIHCTDIKKAHKKAQRPFITIEITSSMLQSNIVYNESNVFIFINILN